jgi:hypothetical protein
MSTVVVLLPLTDEQADYWRAVREEHTNSSSRWGCRFCWRHDCAQLLDAVAYLALAGRK